MTFVTCNNDYADTKFLNGKVGPGECLDYENDISIRNEKEKEQSIVKNLTKNHKYRCNNATKKYTMGGFMRVLCKD